MLNYYGKSEHYEETKSWYDGYRFGLTEVYNPWDVINHCFELNTNPYASAKSILGEYQWKRHHTPADHYGKSDYQERD